MAALDTSAVELNDNDITYLIDSKNITDSPHEYYPYDVPIFDEISANQSTNASFDSNTTNYDPTTYNGTMLVSADEFEWCPNTILSQIKILPCIVCAAVALFGFFLCLFGEA